MEINYEELAESGFYSYVAVHYWEMSKDQLADFVKEICFAASSYFHRECGYESGEAEYKKHIEAEAILELKEREV